MTQICVLLPRTFLALARAGEWGTPPAVSRAVALGVAVIPLLDTVGLSSCCKWGSGISVADSGQTLSWAVQGNPSRLWRGLAWTTHSREKLLEEHRQLAMKSLQLKWLNVTWFLWGLYWKAGTRTDAPFSVTSLCVGEKSKWSRGGIPGAGCEYGTWGCAGVCD